MRLDHMTWQEVEAYLARDGRVVLAAGSIEQHGPIGLIGTDAICAAAIARAAAQRAGVIAAPPLAYAPAPFNTAFPGTVSLSEPVFEALASEVLSGLAAQGFTDIHVVNGHGANLAALGRVAGTVSGARIVVRSWWDHAAVRDLRDDLYGDWEGMHATPSEVAITQHLTGIVHVGAETPPEKLSADFMRTHSGDRHGPPEAHRAAFPDGRVGSHSALARPEHGARLFEAAVAAVASDLEGLPHA